MYLNTNTGPERVEVIPVPLGTVQVPGAATAITAFIISSDFPGAPTNTVVQIAQLSDFTSQFGTEANAGQGYWAVYGFYANAGSGAPALIVNVAPSSPSGNLVTFSALSDDVRDPVGDGAVAFTGMSSAASGGAGYVIDDNYVMNDNILQGDMIIQQGASLGSATVNSTAGNVLSGSGFLTINTQVGDFIYDGTSYYLVTSVVSDTEITVDRNGFSAGGSKTLYSTNTNIILGNQHIASSTVTWNPVTGGNPHGYATSSSAGSLVVDDPTTPPQAVGSLTENMLVSGDIQQQILSNTIQAGTTIQFANSTPNTFTYTPATGLVQYAGTPDLSGAAVGSVFRDGSGNDYQVTAINVGAYNLNIATLNSPPSAYVRPASINTTAGANAGGSIRDGATVLNFVNTTFNLGTSSSFEVYQPAVKITFASSGSGASGTYFVVTPMLTDADYIGTAANGFGLNALNTTDMVDLICIPGVYSADVQLALINYVTVTRNDCFGLLSIPPYITTSSTDTLVAQINIVSITNGSESSILHLTPGTNLSQVTTNMVVEIGGNLYPILNVDQVDSELEVASTSISSTGAATINSVSAVTYKNVIVNSPSTQCAWYFNQLIVDDTNGNAVQVDPVGFVAGVMARIDQNTQIGGVSHAPAGIQFAQLAGTVGLQLALSENIDGYPLRSNFINRITSFPGSGRVIFGAYTAGGNSVTPDEQLIQVIRSVLYIKNSLEPGLRGFIWENQSPTNLNNIANAVAAFCASNIYLFPAGLPQAQQFVVTPVQPTQADLDVGLVRVILQVRFNTAIRFIEIDLEYPLPLAS
jgi:hypothetical protein